LGGVAFRQLTAGGVVLLSLLSIGATMASSRATRRRDRIATTRSPALGEAGPTGGSNVRREPELPRYGAAT